MKKLWVFFSILGLNVLAQNISQCRQRFDHYLNFRGALNGLVGFEKDHIAIYSGGKKQLAIYEEEIPVLAIVFENTNVAEQERLIRHKGLRRFNHAELD